MENGPPPTQPDPPPRPALTTVTHVEYVPGTDHPTTAPDAAAFAARLAELAAGDPSGAAPAPPPAPPAVPGYEIVGELGRGGMGVVYRARQVRAGREVALKMVLGGGQAGAAAAARFRAEAVAVSRLQHPNIVGVYEVGEHDGRPFFSMEFCPGGSLAGRAGGAPLAARAAADLVLRVARGVAAAHAAGVVHRDLKPGNVLLDAAGEPKVADFGLAKRVGPDPADGLTATGAVLGTPAYMAPEQAGGARRVGPAADVYALGAVLYELLTGRPPFQGRTAADTLLQVLTEDPRPPRAVCPGVPAELEAVCLRCLDKDPARRYPTARELADDLARFLAGEPVSAARSGVLDRLAGAFGRARLHDRHARYGTLLLALAPVMFLPELWVTAVVLNGWPGHLLAVGQCGRAAAFLALLGYARGWRWWPDGPAERQLWAVWGGYLAACFAFGFSTRLALGFLDTGLELTFYPALSCLTALAFAALAPTFWGYCAVVGGGFLALAFVMAADLRWAPVEFGALWAAVLVLLGVRLRGLARAAGADPDGGPD